MSICVYLIDVVARMGQHASLVMEKCAFNEHKEEYSLFRAFACCLDPVLKSTPELWRFWTGRSAVRRRVCKYDHLTLAFPDVHFRL